MQGVELIDIVNKIPSLKPFFKGVYSINTLPKKLKIKNFIFCNTALDFEVGKHWICFVKISSSTVECFNSLGFSQTSNLLHTYCKFTNVQDLEFNVTSVQKPDSDTCGLFVLYFIIQRMHNLDIPFKNLMNEIFSNDLNKNEDNVTTFINTIV